MSSLLTQVKRKRDSLLTQPIASTSTIQQQSLPSPRMRSGLPALFVKIAPDLTQSERRDIADVCLSVGVDGLIISNTTIARPPELRSHFQTEVGGLSGAPLKHVSTQLISDMYELTHGKLVLIGVGGVETGLDAYEKIKAGASLIQVYSSFAYGGPYQIHLIKRDLNMLLKQDGFTNIQQAVGINHRKQQHK